MAYALAHKAKHAVDLDTGTIVAVTLQKADKGDTVTLDKTLIEAGVVVAEFIESEAEIHPKNKPQVNVNGIEEVVADKGYRSGAPLKRMNRYRVRSYIPERAQRDWRKWKNKTKQPSAGTKRIRQKLTPAARRACREKFCAFL